MNANRETDIRYTSYILASSKTPTSFYFILYIFFEREITFTVVEKRELYMLIG